MTLKKLEDIEQELKEDLGDTSAPVIIVVAICAFMVAMFVFI
jgi:hypothetical protein